MAEPPPIRRLDHALLDRVSAEASRHPRLRMNYTFHRHEEAVQRFLASDPTVRALVSSGYSNDPVMANYADHGFCGVITKPYRLADLAAALKTATHSAPAAQC